MFPVIPGISETAVPLIRIEYLWSNYNSAIDINSNSTITVADNFGMFNISFPGSDHQ